MVLPCKEKRWGRGRCATTVGRVNATLNSAGFQHTHSQVLQQLEARQPDPPSTVPTSAESGDSPEQGLRGSTSRGELRDQEAKVTFEFLSGLHKLFCSPGEHNSAVRKISAQRQGIEQINHGNWCY